MTRGTLTAIALGAALTAGSPGAAQAQGVSVALGHFFAEQDRTVFRFDVARPLAGSLGLVLHGTAVASPAGASRPLWGAGADLSLFQNGTPGFYAIAGLDGGFGLDQAETLWGSWSAGLGYERFPFDRLVVGVEGRWRELVPGAERGAEVSIRLGARFGPVGRPAPPRPGIGRPAVALTGPRPAGMEVAAALDAVVATAGEAIGTRYQLGGEGEAGDGFDCSGLIQYAYAEHGIEIPRRSVDQARAGREIGRDRDDLRPGDILTFATSGTRVSHVGMYIGNGRFIHSASRGVRVSLLDDDDPDGRYWLQRWVGSRRILE